MDRGYRLINFILASGVIAVLKKIFLFGERHASFSNNRGNVKTSSNFLAEKIREDFQTRLNPFIFIIFKLKQNLWNKIEQ